MNLRKLTEEQCAQAVTFLSTGMLQKDCAEKFGISRSTMWKIARRAGIRINNTDPLSPEMEARAIELARRGFGEPRITRTLSIPRHRVRQLLRKFLLARTGSNEPRERLSGLEEAAIRTAFRDFEKKIAAEHNCELDVIQRLLRRRK
jgi:hypothetical protein